MVPLKVCVTPGSKKIELGRFQGFALFRFSPGGQHEAHQGIFENTYIFSNGGRGYLTIICQFSEINYLGVGKSHRFKEAGKGGSFLTTKEAYTMYLYPSQPFLTDLP